MDPGHEGCQIMAYINRRRFLATKARRHRHAGRGAASHADSMLAASSYNAKIAALESAPSWIGEHLDVIDKDDIHLLIDNKSVIQSFLQMQDLRRLLMAGNGSHKIPSDRRKVRRCQRHLEVRHPTWAAPGSSIP